MKTKKSSKTYDTANMGQMKKRSLDLLKTLALALGGLSFGNLFVPTI